MDYDADEFYEELEKAFDKGDRAVFFVRWACDQDDGELEKPV